MTGAIALAGMAALRSGAGLVRLAVPEECLATVAAHEPSYMTANLPGDEAGHISIRALPVLEELVQSATATACGPGLGRCRGLSHLVSRLYERIDRPMVLDADALTALADAGIFSEDRAPASSPRVLTPHPGEFARLLGVSTADVQKQRETLASQFASRHGIALVLKGHRTIVTDGKRMAINSTGNPGMATGGTGDVLTGVITALICQGLPAYEAARLGVHAHGLAGDLAAAELGQVSLIASDLLRSLPAAFQALQDGNSL